MRSLNIRLGKGLNKRMGTHGRVIASRYHARELRTPTEVRNARHYVLNNHEHHFGKTSTVDSFSSAVATNVPQATTWLLSVGWQRGGRDP
jgi:hypothetical protein